VQTIGIAESVVTNVSVVGPIRFNSAPFAQDTLNLRINQTKQPRCC